MDFSSFSRKELQALCKEKGIPANKTNVYMADALAELQRTPLSPMVVNKVERKIRLKGSPQPVAVAKENDRLADHTLKIPAAAKRATSSFTGIPSRRDFTEKAVKSEKVEFAATRPVFANNFLSRGKRKDPPESQEKEIEEKVKVRRSQQTVSNSSRISQAPVAAVELRKAEPTLATVGEGRTDPIEQSKVSNSLEIAQAPAAAVVKLTAELTPGTVGEGRIDPTEQQSKVEDPVTAAQVRIDTNSKSEARNDSNGDSEINLDCLSTPRFVQDSSQRSHEDREGAVQNINLDFSFPACPERDVKVTGESLLAMIPRHCTAAEELDTPPVHLSPLLRMEERVRRMVERVTSFSWKWPANDLAEVNSGSHL